MKSYDRLGETTELSRRGVLSLAAGAALLGERAAIAQPSPGSFVDRLAIQQIADRDPALRPPLLVDMQTHVWWRANGPRTLTDRGERFLRTLAGSRAAVVGRPVPIADMGRVLFFEDVLLESQTDVAFLNSFGMRAAFDGVDLFPPREAAFIRSMAPARVRVLGTVDPPDGASAVESLAYQCEELKIDGLKLYPPGPDTRGWRMDDEKATYPIYETLRKHGVRNICVHKGVPGLFLAEYCHTDDMARAAADFPDLNFIAYHSAIPWEAELAEHGRRSTAKNLCGTRHNGFSDRPKPRTLRKVDWGAIGRPRSRQHSLGNRHAGDRTAAMADRSIPGLYDPRRSHRAVRLSAIDKPSEAQNSGRERR